MYRAGTGGNNMYKHVVIYFKLLKYARLNIQGLSTIIMYHIYVLVIFGRSEKSEDIQYKMHQTIGKESGN